jgi:hypothetical protein
MGAMKVMAATAAEHFLQLSRFQATTTIADKVKDSWQKGR